MSSIPRTGNATLDATLLMVLLTPTAVMIAAETGAQLARNILGKVMPVLGEPRHLG
jgi:hypothetical protein